MSNPRGRGRGRGGDRGAGPGQGYRGGGPGPNTGRGGRGAEGGRGGGRGGPGAFPRGGGFGGYDHGPRGGGPPHGFGRGQHSGPIIFDPGTPLSVDNRLSNPQLDQLINSFKKLDVRNELPLRPGYGTMGRPITLRANFFPVRLPKGSIYDYSIKFTPSMDIKRVKSRILLLLETSPSFSSHMNSIAHDRSERLVSAKKLPQPLDIQVPFYEEGESGPQPDGKIYTVSIGFTQELNMGD